MGIRIVLSIFLFMTSVHGQTSSKPNALEVLKPHIVSLCSKYCEIREPCKSDEPIIYAPMDEIVGSKSPATNVQVNVHGTPGPRIVDGHKGKAIFLPNGGRTYNNNYLRLTGYPTKCIDDIDECDDGYTISFWFKMANGNHPWPVMVGGIDWQVWNQDSRLGNSPYMSWWHKNGKRWLMSGRSATNEEWHHIGVVARNRTDVRFFIDGELASSTYRLHGQNSFGGGTGMSVGCISNANCATAAFDELKIWDKAKTDKEIKDIFLS